MSNPLFSLTDRVALVTGGSRGLGKAMARAFAGAGAQVIISSRSSGDLKRALEEILQDLDSEGIYLPADLSVREETEQLARQALAWKGHVDILVNNAGMNVPQAIDEVTDDQWDKTLELNLTAGMVLTRALAPKMKEHRWGRIIYTSSILGLAAKDRRNSYSATKTALLGLTKANALDLGPFNITVNAIAPGPFDTEMTQGLLDEEQKRAFANRTALGRWGKPRELAGPALLLASEAGSFITGSVLVVDGGLLSMTF